MQSNEMVEPVDSLRMSELEILTIPRAAKILRVDRHEIMDACEVYRQSGGKAGLRCFRKGARTCIRAGALKDWLISLEDREVA